MAIYNGREVTVVSYPESFYDVSSRVIIRHEDGAQESVLKAKIRLSDDERTKFLETERKKLDDIEKAYALKDKEEATAVTPVVVEKKTSIWSKEKK